MKSRKGRDGGQRERRLMLRQTNKQTVKERELGRYMYTVTDRKTDGHRRPRTDGQTVVKTLRMLSGGISYLNELLGGHSR